MTEEKKGQKGGGSSKVDRSMWRRHTNVGNRRAQKRRVDKEQKIREETTRESNRRGEGRRQERFKWGGEGRAGVCIGDGRIVEQSRLQARQTTKVQNGSGEKKREDNRKEEKVRDKQRIWREEGYKRRQDSRRAGTGEERERERIGEKQRG